MRAEKGLGIWLDHQDAHLMEFSSDPIVTETLVSPFTHIEKESTLGRSENLMHRKEQHEEAEYYKELGKIILKYTEVVLFGPTDAKHELFNYLRKDHRFNEIEIDVVSADKMTENQQHAFVRDFFTKRFFLI
jgi:stalled ribosome rescue protein Dom34